MKGFTSNIVFHSGAKKMKTKTFDRKKSFYFTFFRMIGKTRYRENRANGGKTVFLSNHLRTPIINFGHAAAGGVLLDDNLL